MHSIGGWAALAGGLYWDRASANMIPRAARERFRVITCRRHPLVFSFNLIKATMELRVAAEEEMEGLDIGERGEEAYPDFTTASDPGVGSVFGPKTSREAFAPLCSLDNFIGGLI